MYCSVLGTWNLGVKFRGGRLHGEDVCAYDTYTMREVGSSKMEVCAYTEVGAYVEKPFVHMTHIQCEGLDHPKWGWALTYTEKLFARMTLIHNVQCEGLDHPKWGWALTRRWALTQDTIWD